MRKISFVFTLLLVSGLARANTYTIDTSHASVGFSVTHMMISETDGKFKQFNGEIVWDETDLTKASISGNIEVGSIDTDNEKRDAHLKSPDFFDVEKNPQITFKTTKIEKQGEKYLAIGDLTIKGVSKSVRIPFSVTKPVQDPMGNTRIGIRGETEINRKDFGITWNKTLDAGGVAVSEEVKITLNAEAILKK